MELILRNDRCCLLHDRESTRLIASCCIVLGVCSKVSESRKIPNLNVLFLYLCVEDVV